MKRIFLRSRFKQSSLNDLVWAARRSFGTALEQGMLTQHSPSASPPTISRHTNPQARSSQLPPPRPRTGPLQRPPPRRTSGNRHPRATHAANLTLIARPNSPDRHTRPGKIPYRSRVCGAASSSGSPRISLFSRLQPFLQNVLISAQAAHSQNPHPNSPDMHTRSKKILAKSRIQGAISSRGRLGYQPTTCH